jgi:dihydroorotate dehydrogenase (NAD+) catalytic subunit
VEVGTANFIDPAVCPKIIDGIEEYMEKNGMNDTKSLTGALIL